MPPRRRALLIAGPTASGKSALAIARAEAERGVVINADALQVYGSLRILTARPSEADEQRVPHRLYGHVAAATPYSVAAWLADIAPLLAACWRDDRLPVICGGSGLYFRALERGLVALPAIPDTVRQRWRNFTGDLHAELLRRDRPAAERLHASDRQRLARALEVFEATGKPLSTWQAEARSEALLDAVAVERCWLELPRAELWARAESRFDHMMVGGALAEAEAMRGTDPAAPVMKAIGLAELLGHLAGETTREAAVRDAKTATRRYIKRQLTWWRGQMPDWAAARGA